MFPSLNSKRFHLQQILPEDQQFIFEGLSNPDVIRFYGVNYNSYSSTLMQMEFYDALLKNGTGIWWKIVAKEKAEPCGAIGFNNYQAKHHKAEAGFWLLPQFWKKGIIKEVLPVMIDYMQSTIRIHRIEALIEEGNDASINAVVAAGFTFEGCLRDCEIKNGKYISLNIYSLLSDNQFV